MFFFFSKLGYLFIQPSLWLLALLLARGVCKVRYKKALNIAIVAIIMVFGNEVLFVKLCTAWQIAPQKLRGFGTYEAGILPGGLTSFDKYNNGFLNGASDRLIETVALYKAGKIKKIVVTGGTIYEDQPHEAFFLQRKLLELGVLQQDIFLESNSRTTYENAVFTKKLIDSLQFRPPFVLVTSALHMRRAIKVFEKAAIPVVPFTANFDVIEKKFEFYDYSIPSLAVICDWSKLTKEVVGLLAYSAFDKA